jgi:hypothetical protein
MVVEIEPKQENLGNCRSPDGEPHPLLLPWNLTMNAPTKSVFTQSRCALSNRRIPMSVACVVVEIEPNQKISPAADLQMGNFIPL